MYISFHKFDKDKFLDASSDFLYTEVSAQHPYKIDRQYDIDHTQTKIQPQTEHVQKKQPLARFPKRLRDPVVNGENLYSFIF